MMDPAVVANFIRELYRGLAVGQYASVEFPSEHDQIDFRQLLAELADVGVLLVVSRAEYFAGAAPEKGTCNADHQVMILAAGDAAGDVKMVEERYISPNDTYSRSDRKWVVLAKGKLAVAREPGNPAFGGHYSR
jgi:hypothetical protein